MAEFAAYLSAVAALVGTFVGGITSIATSWLGQQRQTKEQRRASGAADRPMNLNSGKPWSQMALYDLRYWLEHGDLVEQVADLLCRDVNEVREKMVELGIRERPQP